MKIGFIQKLLASDDDDTVESNNSELNPCSCCPDGKHNNVQQKRKKKRRKSVSRESSSSKKSKPNADYKLQNGEKKRYKKKTAWIGESLGSNFRGDIFFSSLTKENEIYNLEDYVYIKKSENDDTLWIAKILEFMQSKENMNVCVQRLYSWKDIDESKPDSKELFISSDIFTVDVKLISGKCQVIPMNSEEKEHYYFSKGYDPIQKKFFEIPSKDSSKSQAAPEIEDAIEEFGELLKQHRQGCSIPQPSVNNNVQQEKIKV